MVFKLTELYKTKYFYKTFVVDLRFLFNSILDLRADPSKDIFAGSPLHEKLYSAVKSASSIEIDLADAKLTPDVSPVINEFARKGITFIDSSNNVRNYILEENARRSKISEVACVELPPFTTNSMVKDYLNSLSRDVTYTVPYTNDKVYIPLVYLILCVRPTIKIDMGGWGMKFFNFVSENLTTEFICQYNEFYYVTQEGTYITKSTDGMIDTQNMGLVPIQTAMTCGKLIPTVLGNERLVNADVWGNIADSCIEFLNKYKASGKSTLADLYSRG